MVELLKTAATQTRTRLCIYAATAMIILLIHSQTFQISTGAATENGQIINETLVLTAYLDGFVFVAHDFEINQTFPTINVRLLGETRENLLFLDGENVPLDYTISNGLAVIEILGAGTIGVSYLTQDLTTKTTQYWTLKVEVSTSTTVVLPDSTTIISLNEVPERIESTNGRVTLMMPPGTIEITYIAEHSPSGQTLDSGNFELPWFLFAGLTLLLIPAIGLAFVMFRRKKTAQKLEPAIPVESTEVDIEKLFAREKNLRSEEVQVVRFLAEKNGSAFEAELYERLQLPRTTTWRLIKRLERMEIVDTKKSRRQNIVSIRKKYMKK